MKELMVKDVMTRGVITIQQEASVQEAVEMLADNDVSGLAVTDNEELVGVLSETDIVKAFIRDDVDLSRITVSQIMTTPAITINREETLKAACQLMSKHNVHRLIIHQEVKRGDQTRYSPSGILSTSDVVKVMAGRCCHN